MQGKAVALLKGEAGAETMLDFRLEYHPKDMFESYPAPGDNFSHNLIRNKKATIFMF
jgi:hypothetical protein